MRVFSAWPRQANGIRRHSSDPCGSRCAGPPRAHAFLPSRLYAGGPILRHLQRLVPSCSGELRPSGFKEAAQAALLCPSHFHRAFTAIHRANTARLRDRPSPRPCPSLPRTRSHCRRYRRWHRLLESACFHAPQFATSDKRGIAVDVIFPAESAPERCLE